MQKRKVYKKRRAAKKGKGHKERPGSQKKKRYTEKEKACTCDAPRGYRRGNDQQLYNN
jgi:hypothetical protein